MDTTIARLCREMDEASADLQVATRRLVEADPKPFTRAMIAVQRRESAPLSLREPDSMHVPAQAPPGLRQMLCEGDPAAMATLKPCRFCGGSDLLGYQTSYGDWSTYEGDELKVDADGEVVFESYDAVECTSCCVTAPYAIWQAEGDVFAGRKRQAYAAYARDVGIIKVQPQAEAV